MARSQEIRSKQPHVKALFSDGWQSFALPVGATLGDLSNRLADLAAAQFGAALSVEVQLSTLRAADAVRH